MAGRSLVRQKLRRPVSLLPEGYAVFWADVKRRVQMAQVRATLAANEELISLYWDIGRAIHEKQAAQGWGAKIIDQLAMDLRREFPDFQCFSRTNIYRMRAFYVAWREEQAIVPQPVGQLRQQSVPQPVGRLPWGHNVVLLERIANRDERLWYARAALEYGWSRSVLVVQIESRLHKRQGRAITNFTATLPAPQSDLAHQALKDPYIFDFLTMDAAARERDLDLLFYHLRLRCFVVVDLKMEAFKPEFAGKMNFYLSAVDDQLRHRDDQPSIGLLLCKERNRLIVEYALRDVKKPIGVAEWRTRLVESLPKKLQSSLPTVKQIEAELAVELQPVTAAGKGSVK